MSQLILGDSYPIMYEMPDDSVDATVTDPPYGANVAEWDKKPISYLDVIEILRVTRGPVLMFGGRSPLELKHYLDLKIPPERMLVWTPPFTAARGSLNAMFYHWHPIWCWNLPAKQQELSYDVITVPTEVHNWWYHPGTKPLKLMKKLIRMSLPEGGVVLDPYLGSGTTAVACVEEGMDYIGIEINPEYYEIAKKRIECAQPPLIPSTMQLEQLELFTV